MTYFRCDRYIVVEGKADAFTAFFVRHLLPLREKYGARLVGRWQTADEVEVLTLWAYASQAAAEQAEALVRDDPAFEAARAFQERYLEPLFHEQAEMPLYSTVALEQTALSGLVFEPERR
jgi:hypothetical protein